MNSNPPNRSVKMSNFSLILNDDHELKKYLKATAAEILKISISDIDENSPFSEYGIRGSTIQNFIDRINEILTVKLKITDLFSYPDISSLANDIIKKHSTSQKFDINEEVFQNQKSEQTFLNKNDDIAVIGMSGKFGYTDNIDEFFEALKEGKSLIQEVPRSRWETEEYYTTDRENTQKTYSKWGSFLKDIDKFDPSFFRISGRDAEIMDPQHRLFLEECWKALEDAAINPEELKSLRCGIFATSGLSDYIGKESEEASSWWGNDPAVLPARISYFLDTKGPAIAVDTACSSSLTAIHLACNSLKNGESNIAITGGVWISTRHFFYNKASRARMLSPDGTCYTFDERANGFVPGEAVGVLILKRLEDAERDGDQIHGVIKGTYSNQDGSTNGITAPSCLAQQSLMREAFEKFNINPKTIGYVEAHGTGTRLGDPIEFEALNTVFKEFTTEKKFCNLGSVKTNMGHSVMAAGVSGVIKVILSLKNQVFMPSLNFKSPNPLIDLDDSAFIIQTQPQPWIQSQQTPRRGTVSSFGFSGTNVFTILEEYQKPPKKNTINGAALILLSAQNKDQLKESAENLKKYLYKNPEINIHDIAYTLQTGRKHMDEKVCIVAENCKELIYKLENKIFTSKKSYPESDTKELTAHAINERDWEILGNLWLHNFPIDWHSLYSENIPSKISLPSYPFAKDTYWAKAKNPENKNQLHPLVHFNTSNFSKQQFESKFNGKEFFFSDHKVGGSAMLPGVAYLEMVRAATELSQNKTVKGLGKINWISPIIETEKEIEVKIKLKSDESDIYYEIESGEDSNELKSKGIVYLENNEDSKVINLQRLFMNFTNYWDKETCYNSFKQIGLDYGTHFQGIEKLYFNQSEALCEISLPRPKDIKWNIGLLDSVLQSCVGLALSNGDRRLMIPFQLEKIMFFNELEDTVWAHVRKNKSINERMSAFDIDIISSKGEIICSMTEFLWSNIEINAQVEVLPKVEFSVNYEESSLPDKIATKETPIEVIREFVANIVKFDKDKIKTSQDLMNYGFDSSMLIILAKEMNDFYNIKLTPALFYTYSTIDELVGFLEENHLEEIQKRHPVISENSVAAVETKEEIKFKEIPNYTNYTSDAVVIVGISGRFPGSENLNDFWENLRDQKSMITEVPADRWDWKEIYGDPVVEPNKTKAKWGGFISDIDKFDALFFGISPAEAALIDPQQRIFIEAVYNALEDGGITPSALKGTDTGVFVGTFSNDYASLLQEHEDLCIQGQVASGTIHSILANRVSYLLDIHGPSEPIDTACSASLIAIGRAADSIKEGRCKIAIAGGVNAILSPEITLSASNAGMLSETGNCRSFDASANGYVRSEGVGVVVLKTLEQAKKDGDHIYAVIRGTSENHGGRANTLISPNPLAQRDLLLKAYRSAGIDPSTVSYIETHGTGTPLGDPIETEGLKMAFDILYKEWGKEISEIPNCAIGSVKSNVGHLESAAGMAGLMKVLFAMKHQVLPGNPMLNEPNPHIRLNESPFYLLKETKPWKTLNNLPRIAGISSFGYGGVNAHIILEEYKYEANNENFEDEKMIIPLSAKNSDRLQKRMEDLLIYIKQNPQEKLQNIAFTLQVGREAMDKRIAFLAENINDLQQSIQNYLDGNESGAIIEANQVEVAQENENDLNYLAQSWINGEQINWSKFHHKTPLKLSLPTYPFYKKSHWFSAPKKQIENNSGIISHPMLVNDYSTKEDSSYQFKFAGNEDYLKDHVVNQKVLFPAVAYIEMVVATLQKNNHDKTIEINDCNWIAPFYPGDLMLKLNNSEPFKFNFSSEQGLHCRGKVMVKERGNLPELLNINKLKENFKNSQNGNVYYSILSHYGLNYGKTFQGIEEIFYGGGAALAKINLEAKPECILTPALFDSAFQTVIATLFDDGINGILVPTHAGSINVYGRLPGKIWSHVKRKVTNHQEHIFDIIITDDIGNKLVEIIDLVAYPLNKEEKKHDVMESQNETKTRLYNYSWQMSSSSVTENKKSDFQHVFLFEPISENFIQLLKNRFSAAITLMPEVSIEERFVLILNTIKKIKKGKIALIYDNEDYAKHNYLSGLLKTMNLENPYVSGVIIGIDKHDYERNFSSIVAVLEKEQYQTDVEVKIENEQRWIKKLTPVIDRTFTSMAKPGGVYLITGGAGGVGKILSEYLAKDNTVQVIITGRTAEDKIKTSQSNIHYFKCDISNSSDTHLLIQKIKYQFGNLSGVIHGAGVIQDNYLVNKTQQEIHNVFVPKIDGTINLDKETSNEKLDFFILLSSLASIAGNIGQADYSSANAWMDNFATQRNQQVKMGEKFGATRSINWPLWKDGGMQIDEVTADFLEKKWGMLPMPSSEGIRALEALLFQNIDQGVAIYGNKEFSLNENEELQTNSSENALADLNPVVIKNQIVDYILTSICSILDYDKKELDPDSELRDYGFSSYLLVKFGNDLNSYYDINEPPSIFYNYPTVNDMADFLWDTHPEKMLAKSDKKIEYSEIDNQKEEYPVFSEGKIKDQIVDYILTSICNILDYDKEELDPDSELRDYGFSSYLLVKFGNDLNSYYDINEPPSIFYNYPTVNDMADFLWDTHPEKMLAKSDKKIEYFEIDDYKEEYPVLSEENLDEINEESYDEGVAVIGIAGRFPGANDVDALWEVVKNNQDVITEIPEDRWDWKKYDGQLGEALNKTKAKWGGFIEDIDKFDADYFNINPKEAEIMDPQQRLTLETVHTALEDGGIAPSSLKGTNTGVYIGVMNNDYSAMLRKLPELSRHAYTIVNSDSILANRVSYVLDLHGPSEPVKTACSSSLIAIHRAADAIRRKKCDMAIAGGVNAILIPETTLMISNAGMLSETGRCWSFDERANGYVRSEGVGVVILKSLRQAKKDGDRIYGIIKGGAENHGGRATSLTAPNPKAQRDLLLQAYHNAGIDPSRISYIEAHGTGTALGDPIEIEALKMAFNALYEEKGITKSEYPICGIGSIKANMGHTESASGVAGFIKVLMALQHKTLPGNPNLHNPNPYLQISGSPFYLLKDTKPWEHDNLQPRIAGISSFGFGGANGHVILEEYRRKPVGNDKEGNALMILSAKNKERLKEYVEKLYNHIKLNPSENIHSIAYTLQIGREHLEERVGWITDSLKDFKEQLEYYLKGDEPQFTGNTIHGKASLKILNQTFDENAKLRLINENNYKQLASLWCVGMKFDWPAQYPENCPERIKLPTYPFERKRYWPSEKKTETLSGILKVEREDFKVVNQLVNIIAKTINKSTEELNIKADFFEFGLDSVSGFELIRDINQSLKIKVDFNILYEYTTIESLAAFIEKEMMAGTPELV